MTREEAIKLIDTHTVCFYNEIDSPTLQALHLAIEALSAEANSDDLIIRGAKGIQDGLYNIKDGKLFKYKAKGGTVRAYEIVPSAEAEEYEDYEHATLVDIKEPLRSSAEAVHGDGKMMPIELKKRYPHSRDEDITDAFMRGYKSAQAVQGEWTDIDDYYRMATCSRCHKVTMFEKWGEYTKPYDFCPNCGADMRKENK